MEPEQLHQEKETKKEVLLGRRNITSRRTIPFESFDLDTNISIEKRTPSRIMRHFARKHNLDFYIDCYNKNFEAVLNTNFPPRSFIHANYSDVEPLLKKLYRELLREPSFTQPQSGRTSSNERVYFVLLPIRTNTTYFHELVLENVFCRRVYLLKGRLVLEPHRKQTPYASCIVKLTSNRSQRKAEKKRLDENPEIRSIYTSSRGGGLIDLQRNRPNIIDIGGGL